jgi:integration host factor subunit alpha
MAALTKIELAEDIHNVLGLNKREAMDIIECFFEEVRIALERGEQVKISGFGNFDLRDKKERPGRNPKTGQVIPVASRRVVTFHVGQKLKTKVKKHAATNKTEKK